MHPWTRVYRHGSANQTMKGFLLSQTPPAGNFRNGHAVKPLSIPWELPNQKSESYWNDVCNDLEKKVRKVRNPFSHFPFIYHSNNNLYFDPLDSVELKNLSQVQSHEEPVVKVSPPTPLRKLSFIFATENFHNKNHTVNKNDIQFDDNVLLELHLLKEKKDLCSNSFRKDKSDITNLQFYTKKKCPFHKNEPAPQIFDEDLKKYLSSKKVQPLISKISCSLHSNKIERDDNVIEKIKNQTSLEIDNLDNLIETNDLHKKNSLSFNTQKLIKAPKLGKASLLASFAKTVSIPSSIETYESLDKDNSKSDINLDTQTEKNILKESEEKLEIPKSIPKDYLKVPKLGYASLHPSFRKLIPMDSFSIDNKSEAENNSIQEMVFEYSFSFNKPEIDDMKNESITKVEKTFQTEQNSKTCQDKSLNCNDKETRNGLQISQTKTQETNKSSSKKNQSVRYAHRALKYLTKQKDLNYFPLKYNLEITKSETSSISEIKLTNKSIKRRKEQIVSTNYRKLHEKLRTISSKYLGENYFPLIKKSDEIKTIISTTRSTSGSSTKFQNIQFESKSLTSIPSLKMYPRKNSDRCLPCLFKTFENTVKPILPQQSIIKSSDDESSVTIPDLENPVLESLIPVRESSAKVTKDLTKDYTLQISQETESNLPKDYSLSPKSTDLKKLSLKSSSAQSTDISKPSTPSGQSSESEDAQADMSNEAIDITKNLAPLHTPLIWKPSLESLKALRSRKAISIQSRVNLIVSKSLDDSDVDDVSSDVSTPKGSRKQEEKSLIKSVTIQSPKTKIDSKKGDIDKPALKGKRKKLSRTKTTMGEINVFAKDEEKKARLIRAETSVDLTLKFSESRKIFFDTENDGESYNKNFNQLIANKKSLELSPDQKELLEILEKCLNNEKSSRDILNTLCNWYSIRNKEIRKSDTDPDLKKTLKISLNLLRLLAESRRYLNSDKFSPDLEFSLQQPFQCNSRQLRRTLPLKLYNKLAPILNMPVWYPKNLTELEINVPQNEIFKNETSTSDLLTDLIVHPPSQNQSSLDDRQMKNLNPYYRFLRKPRRKSVIWRSLNAEDLKGYNPDDSLHNRATKITDKISQEFCEWLQELSGPLQHINEEVLKDMFQIIFTADACQSTKVFIKELPTVPKPVALVRNSANAIELQMTRKELIHDRKIENKPKTTIAFGTALPKNMRFVPPSNKVKEKWFLRKNICDDLKSMEIVWNGIKHLEVTNRYIDWIKINTNIKVPNILNCDVQTNVSVSKFSQADTIFSEEYEKQNIICN
ncbi:uncharacterized protein LOC122502388 [Leptopilina heterotoma]|uniref:uncharacterized protein LOC122502388 n=1 Tax=Leptopilina heterotoma TaxID=63436 RepID=UPI001CA95048|nr:uncharacterized protein LOC122502388 [Leptopilina heterotoma]